MTVLVTDPLLACELIAAREASPADRWTEVWDGVVVMPAVPNNEHQRLVLRLAVPFAAVVDGDGGDSVLPGANVSDREADWKSNYRIPDVVVCLARGRAKDCGAFWCGGPDLAVEIASPGEDPRLKLGFYAAVGTRELLVVERKPWALELYQLVGGKLQSAGRSDVANPATLTSSVLPLAFQLQAGTPRPTILISHTATGQTWTA